MKKSISIFSVSLIVLFSVIGLHQVQAQEQLNRKPAITDPAKTSGVKVYLSGSAKLVEGKAEVKFREDLSEFIKKDDSGIKILVTPVGSWSGIYVMSIYKDGFTVKSATGDQNAIFNWILVKETNKIRNTESKNKK